MLGNRILPLLFLFSFSLNAQQEDQKRDNLLSKDTVYDLIDPMQNAVFPGGERVLMKYLTDSIQYPAIPAGKNITGTLIVVSFVIQEDGSVSDVVILKDVGFGFGEEVSRAVGRMPKWTPARWYDRPVPMRYTLPIRVELQ